MNGFSIWDSPDNCIHEEIGFDVEYTEDLYDDILGWFDSNCEQCKADGVEPYNAEDLLVKIYVDGEEEELSLKEIMEIEGV